MLWTDTRCYTPLQRHNKGDTPQTRDGRPWEIAYTEVCLTREIAVNREKN